LPHARSCQARRSLARPACACCQPRCSCGHRIRLAADVGTRRPVQGSKHHQCRGTTGAEIDGGAGGMGGQVAWYDGRSLGVWCGVVGVESGASGTNPTGCAVDATLFSGAGRITWGATARGWLYAGGAAAALLHLRGLLCSLGRCRCTGASCCCCCCRCSGGAWLRHAGEVADLPAGGRGEAGFGVLWRGCGRTVSATGWGLRRTSWKSRGSACCGRPPTGMRRRP